MAPAAGLAAVAVPVGRPALNRPTPAPDPAPSRTRPAATDRLFFAVYPDAPARARLQALAARLRAAHRLAGPAFAPERMHLTLAMAGDHAGLPQDLLERVLAIGAALRARPFEIGFDRTTSFERPRRKPCVLLAHVGVETLVGLHEALDAALVAAGVTARPDRRFRPHLTLQYDDRGLPDEPVEPIGWTVREFVLMRSLLGRGRHVELARWPLQG